MTNFEKSEQFIKEIEFKNGGDVKAIWISAVESFAQWLDKQENEKKHKHYFKFSHFETESAPGSTAVIGNIRIIICRTCGEVIRDINI